MASTDLGRPNIVLIFSDQHRGDALGCAGNGVVKTPHLDKLAAEGVVFTNCHTSSPLCMPARASLLSGLYVNEHGAWGNRHEANRFGQSHVRNIRDAGYCTAVIGKTHFSVPQADGGHVREREHLLRDWGYEVTHQVEETIPSPTNRCHYADFLAERNKLQVYEDECRTWRLGQQYCSLRPWEHTPWLLEEDEHMDAYIADTAVKWIESYSETRPFYLQAAFTGPHPPFNAPAAYRDLFDPVDMPHAIMEAPAAPVSPQVSAMLQRRGLYGMTEGQSRLMTSHYYAKVAFVDHAIGKVLEALADKGLMDNTWIIYTSDHGEMLGDHRLCQKVVFYEGALNIPLIVRPPGGARARSSRGLTDHFDITRTMVEVASAARLAKDHGVSLVPRVAGGEDTDDADRGKEVVFSEVNLYSMVRTERYKLTAGSVSHEPLEFYDLEDDPHELRNLVDDPGHAEMRSHLLSEHLVPMLANLNQAQLDVYRNGGIQTKLHHQYPEY